MKAKKFVYSAAVVGLIVVGTVILNRKSAHAAPVERSSSAVTGAESKEVGAPPDSVYGEAIETPNHQRQRLAAEAAESQGASPAQQAPSADAVRLPEPPAPKLVAPRPDSHKERRKTAAQPSKKAAIENSVPDSPTAQDAIELSNRWQNQRDTPAEGKDGHVVFAEGAGLPTVVCAPLRLCIIQLQSGEKLNGPPQIGDSVRWNVEPASYGAGERATPLIVLKPRAVGLDTNLVITTDRRSYYLRLLSSSQDYVARVSFEYPDDEQTHWSEALSKQDQATREAKLEKEVKTLAGSVENLNIDYRITGDKTIRPVLVLDDGVHTYVQMNPAILHREAPVLAVVGPDGKAEIVNYRVQGNVYVVDRLFDRARLILGSGRKARKADITSSAVKDHGLFARDPFRGLESDGSRGESSR